MRIGILGSTRGTHLTSIHEAIQREEVPATIAVVFSNIATAGILEKAKNYAYPYYYLAPQNLSREIYDAQVSKILKEKQVDLIILVGYMRILSKKFVDEWAGRIINVHPSLLPAFAGKMDLAVHEAVIAAGVSETGCTVHYVNEIVDGGPIVLQNKCAVFKDDTPQTLKNRVQALEGAALVAAIKKLIVAK